MGRHPGPSKPPDERRCVEIRTYPSGDPSGRCWNWTLTGKSVCYKHDGHDHIGTPPDERRCTGTTKNRENAGRRCPEWAMKGQTVCAAHGGKSPQALKTAARRIAEAKLMKEANRLLVQLGANPVDNPLTALSALAGEVLAFKNALGAKVNELEEIRYKGGAGEQLRAEVALYERAVKQAGDLLANIARLNIDERLAAITEKQAEKVMLAIDAALTSAGITGDAAHNAKRVAARKLRSVA
jgi:hypothetical protein